MKPLYLSLGTVGWLIGAAILGTAVNWDDRLTPVLAGAWTLGIMAAALLTWWRGGRRVR